MYLGRTKKYSFHSIEIHKEAEEDLKDLAEACERVEKEVWSACENFYSYLKKQSTLFIAKKSEKIVAFALFDLRLRNDSLIVAANECMVLKEDQGNGLPTLFMAIMISHIRKDNRLQKKKRPYKHVIFVSSTVHYKLMASFRRYRFLAVKDSFYPDREIKEIAKEYRQKYEWKPLQENPFFIKAAFPGATRLKAVIEKPEFVPDSFNFSRGDAFLYVCKIKNFVLLGILAWLVRKKYRFRFSKQILLIGKMAKDNVIYTNPEKH